MLLGLTSALRRVICAIALATLAFSGSVTAQTNLFAPVVQIDGGAVTEYEVQQRLRFLTLLRAPNATRDGVIETLTNEFIQNQAARRAGIRLEGAEVRAGIAEFAGRANLDADQFLQIVTANGIAEETVRDFVTAGLTWRRYIQQRFGPRAQVSEAELRRASAATSGQSSVRILLSEIALPLTPDRAERSRALATQLARDIRGPQDFAAAARRHSAAPTRSRGGRLDWLPLSRIPPQVASQLLVLGPGEVSDPINMGSFIALFLVRDIDESAPQPRGELAVEYAIVPIAGGYNPAAFEVAKRLKARSDTCDDLYGTTRGQPVGAIDRQVQAPADIPRDVAVELAKLDDGEVSTLLTDRAGNLRFIMLCGRTVELAEDQLEGLGQQLRGQRLESYAAGHLDELRAAARITRVDG